MKIAIVCNYELNPNRIGGMDQFWVGYDTKAKALGHEVPRILEFYNKDCFKFSEHFLRMTFPVDKEDTTISGGAIGGAIAIGSQILELTQRQNEVLDVLKQDSKISYRTIAKQLNINESAVLKHLEILKEKGYLERIGGTRGFWKIKRNSNND